MRLFFEDPSGERLALDTNQKEWAATYETEDTKITDNHFIINVEDPEVLRRIEREADFCGYGYNNEIDNETRAPQTSVYAEYLQELAAFNIEAEAAGEYDDGQSSEDPAERLAEKLERLTARTEHAKEIGYFNARQYAALILILDEIRENIELYKQVEAVYKEATEEPEPF